MSGAICVFGEVLFDHFPDGSRVLGGAPFNVAWNLQSLGEPVSFISRVGDDPEGAEVRAAMKGWGMDTRGLQVDREHPTGQVRVTLQDGEPSYDIVAPSAYDRIRAESQSNPCGLLYHGTLALRDPVSRAALDDLLQTRRPQTVFVDVNLRSPWWSRDDVLRILERADWVKLNEHELELISDGDASTTGAASAFLQRHGLQGLIITRGGAGAELLTASGERGSIAPSASTDVVDTVGAGDAFASVIVLGLARGWPLQEMLERAQAFASAIVAQRGATVSDPDYYRAFLDSWL